MPDIVQILPDSVANQIAAGEVIQRPASAVKELLENSLDAGSSCIRVWVRDAGKTLLQVVDDGCGMSETDARLCFERHATSKIQEAGDLFNIRTLGFRGEALASVAAVGQVELRTRRKDDELGTEIHIEGSQVKAQEMCTCQAGTTIAVKNLFFNVPARRSFLKSNHVEFRHIMEEFERIALSYYEVEMSLTHNDGEALHLKPGTLKNRVIGLLGKNYDERLIPVTEDTNMVRLSGFIVKPQFSRKSRGEQFFFVNRRYIRSGYLNHAVQQAFQNLLLPDTHPCYFLFMEMDPKAIDVNIHPTKAEIKFEDEKALYAILMAAIKRALGRHNIAPTLDFEQEMGFPIPLKPPVEGFRVPHIAINPLYNPFQGKAVGGGNEMPLTVHAEWSGSAEIPEKCSEATVQLHGRFILTSIKNGILLIDQQGAHERILYEKYLNALEKNESITQKQLFTQTVELSPADFGILGEMEKDIRLLGFEIRAFGHNAYIVEGMPAEFTALSSSGQIGASGDCKGLLEGLIEQIRHNRKHLQLGDRDNLARSLAKKTAVKPGRNLQPSERVSLIDQLFACKMPCYTPDGRPTMITLSLNDLLKKFGCCPSRVNTVGSS